MSGVDSTGAPLPPAKKKTTVWFPTWKWWSATVVGCSGLGVAAVTAGHWTQTLSIAAITLASQRLVAYITPNTYGKG